MSKETIVLLEREHTVVYDGQTILFEKSNKHSDFFSALSIPLKYIYSFSFKISSSVSDDELSMQTELKMYKEGGLDTQKEYAIDFIKYDLGDEFLVEAFALSLDDFNQYIAKLPYKTEVVDFAFARFLAYETLYETEESKTSNDLYIYISEEEAFGAIYKNGRYIGHRNINSLSAISKRTGLELVKLKEYLVEKGFKRDNYDLEETLILDAILDVFSKDIEKIVYSINHKRGLFGLTGIDKVYIDFNGEELKGIEEFFIGYGFEPLIEPLTQHKEQASPSLSVLLDYVFNIHNGADFQSINLTHLPRKKPLYYYTGFKYLIETLIVMVLLFAVFLSVEYYLNQQAEELKYLNKKVQAQKKKIEKLSLHVKKLKKKNKTLLAEKKALQEKVFVYDTTFKVIPMVERVSVKRQKMMNDVVKVLKKYHLNASEIHQKDENSFEILLISKANKRSTISKFMQDLLNMGYKSVVTQDIVYEKGVYKSKIHIDKVGHDVKR